MSTPSNLYAEKVFSEHPIALWALDDKADYLSMITENQRHFDNWTITGGLSTHYTSDVSPFPDSITNDVNANITDEHFGEIICISDDIINFSEMNRNLKTFSIGTYFYSDTAAISGFQLGYEYYDVTTGQKVQHLKSFSTPFAKKWTFASETFEIPEDNTTLRIVLKINYFFTSSFENAYNFSINGVSLGQWSEEFNSTSLGATKELLPYWDNIYGVPAVAYGLENDPGYYIVNQNSLMAKNTGIPLVYGATGITKLVPNNSLPSLVIPAKGFLHESGKYSDYTFEMWLRVTSDSSVPKKIFGKSVSEDGLWIDGPNLILKINDHIATYFVGEWGKPMLINIVYGSFGANLLVNGEQVASISFNSSDLDFSISDEKELLCFYSYTDVSPVEIDAVAIYSYQVPSVVAKRRFVYGQAVDFPENINTAYSGSSVFIDYQYANYTNNYIYPDLGKWTQGIKNNLIVKNNILSVPEYSLPELVLNGASASSLTDTIFNSLAQVENTNFFTFKPNSDLHPNGYLLFDNFNFLQEEVKAFYTVIKPTILPIEDEIILHIDSETTSNYFSVVLNGSTIKYNLFYNGQLETIYTSYGITAGEVFPVGINIQKFTEFFGQNILSFFGNRSDLKFYVGGNKHFATSFHGKIFSVGFCNASSLAEVTSLFNAKGTVIEHDDVFDLYGSQIDYDAGAYTGSDPLFWNFILDGGTPEGYASFRLIDHIASYTLIVKDYFGKYYFDIAVKSSWKDYLPLTYFAENVTDVHGNTYYDLDFIQFNIDYPAPSRFVETVSKPITWKYGVPTVINGDVIPSLSGEYISPVQRTYEALDNQLFTGYNNYTDLQNKSSKEYLYDTSKSYVRSYINFEYTSSGLNTSDSYFNSTQGPLKEGVVTPGNDWLKTKYEVVDNMIIYPPDEDIVSLSMVTKLEFVIDGILTHNIKVKTLEYASQALNDSSPNPIGTKFGTSIYPYKKTGYYYDYKSKNPFTIYKKSSPYLFLSRYSGITLKGQYDSLINRGLSIPINESMSEKYKVMAMQTAIRFDQDFFPFAPTQIFEVESKNVHIKFFMVANSSDGSRAKIYAINAKTAQLENGISFYWNGKLVKEPVMTIKEWGFLGIGFSTLLDFKGFVGAIRITGPVTFNTISYYQSTTLQEVQQINTRKWFKVKYAGSETLDWKFWDLAYNWQNVLVISTKSYYGVDPETIYKSYTGTNKILVDSDDIFRLGEYEYNFYKDAGWQQDTISAV